MWRCVTRLKKFLSRINLLYLTTEFRFSEAVERLVQNRGNSPLSTIWEKPVTVPLWKLTMTRLGFK